jgi:hypothetical protein
VLRQAQHALSKVEGRYAGARLRRRAGQAGRLAAGIVALSGWFVVAGAATGPTFFPDDPVWTDDDAAFDASGVAPDELSEAYDFIENVFRSPGDRRDVRAMNVNTVDEVPDSTWFTNRIGRRPMPLDEIVRGPDRPEIRLSDEWTVVRDKGAGFQPGFRATTPSDPGRLYQVEFDPPSNPEMATGAELVGTAIYHAIGFNVVQMYLVEIDPAKLTIAPEATIKTASGRRRFTKADLSDVLRNSARLPNGRYRALASRFADGRGVGHFRHYGTRPDDPNDIYPHEHRRELRANRVFAAWLNHDDSRAINTLDMLVDANGRRHVRHYMFDFGSILGSATRFGDVRQSGREYFLSGRPSWLTLATAGLYVRPWLRYDYPDDLPPAVGNFHATGFEPARWVAEYPNVAFANMRADDAFWGARIVAAFSDEAIAAIVKKARFTDPSAADFVTTALIARRDAIARTWLNGVCPIVNPQLAGDGTLTFENAAIQAGAAVPPRRYTLRWSRFDNDRNAHQPVGGEVVVTEPRGRAPSELLSAGEFVSVAIAADHDAHPGWSTPAQVYFRRTAGGWMLVGLDRR